MSDQTILFFLAVFVVILILVIIYQRIAFGRGAQAKLKQINGKIEEILETDSDEKVMVFTGNPVLKELGAQINRLLNERQKIRADVRREEIASKRMLSNISHDMKTPLTVILGYLEIMRLDRKDDEMLQKAEEKAKQIMDMVNEFFTLAKIEAGDTDITLRRLNICEVCRENVLEFYEMLLKEDFEVEISIPEAAVYVQGDREALQRILYNLLSNVIRYGSDGKYLGVFLRQDENSVYIDVVDKGKGIAKEFAANVFDRLYTVEDSRNREIQGNGLGLTIAKNLAGSLGGELTLSSIPGKRTAFTLKLNKIND